MSDLDQDQKLFLQLYGCYGSFQAVLWTMEKHGFLYVQKGQELTCFLLWTQGIFFFQEVPRWHQFLFHSSLSVCLFSSPKEYPACYPPPVPYEADRSGLGSLVKGPLFFIVPRISTHILTSRTGGSVHFTVKHQRLFFQLKTLWVQKGMVEKGLLMYQFNVCFYIFIYSL